MMTATSEKVCYFFKYGFCKFLDKCKFRHEKALCRKDHCEIQNCASRHPKKCRYFEEFGMCKFGDYCLFSHEIDIAAGKDEVKKLEEKVEAISKLLDEKESNTKCTEEQQNEEINQLNKKLVEMEIIVEDLKDQILIISKKLHQSECLSTVTTTSASSLKQSHPADTTRLTTDCLKTSQTDQTVECCVHRCCPGRGDHNRPPDKSQCCYHRCKKYPHYIQRKPGH